MDEKELRIGNYLHDRENKLCRVEGLSEEEYNEINASVIGHCITSLPIKPIPLTEDWLKKLEINKGVDVHNDYFSGFITVIGITEGNCVLNIGHMQITYIKYVHQLQNLYFALTQKELKLK